jgi:uncharacterized protein YidB (DUF937 family)
VFRRAQECERFAPSLNRQDVIDVIALPNLVKQEANMGLLDVLNGMQQGPRGQPGATSGGMSPITMAVLGLIAYKAIKSFSAGQPGAAPAAPGANPGMPGGASTGGTLGDVLKNGLGGLLDGGAAGSVLSGGLNDLVKQLQQSGLGGIANSWIGSGPNQPISTNDLASALGADQINTLAAHTGMSRDDLLKALSQHLPGAVDKLTPDGRVPTADEAARLL